LPKLKKVRSSGMKILNTPLAIEVRTNSTGNPTAIHMPPSAQLRSNGKWVNVTKVENLWKVNDEWWRGPDEEISRLYYVLRIDSGQQITLFLDLITNKWHRQSG
tara:strand:- start:127 stop:438 length:312 start_codon:yes stop_codon:yes gene_type:complete